LRRLGKGIGKIVIKCIIADFPDYGGFQVFACLDNIALQACGENVTGFGEMPGACLKEGLCVGGK
jgi:hypothetical protein